MNARPHSANSANKKKESLDSEDNSYEEDYV